MIAIYDGNNKNEETRNNKLKQAIKQYKTDVRDDILNRCRDDITFVGGIEAAAIKNPARNLAFLGYQCAVRQGTKEYSEVMEDKCLLDYLDVFNRRGDKGYVYHKNVPEPPLIIEKESYYTDDNDEIVVEVYDDGDPPI